MSEHSIFVFIILSQETKSFHLDADLHANDLEHLRSALSLVRLQIKQHRQSEARKTLAPVYGQFRGFKTVDLHEARAIPESLPTLT
jgi:hypothetical protein